MAQDNNSKIQIFEGQKVYFLRLINGRPLALTQMGSTSKLNEYTPGKAIGKRKSQRSMPVAQHAFSNT